MFNIAIDAAGKSCNAHEIVENKNELSSAKKKKYVCVTCDERHPVFLKVAKEFSDDSHFNVPAWFSHYPDNDTCSEGKQRNKRYKPSPESALHHNAKHILCSNVGQYEFETEKCISCELCSRIEDGSEAEGRVEHFEKLLDGKSYKFDAVLVRKNVVSSVLEVWASHETSNEKREYCLRKGYSFGEFDAAHVLEAHKSANGAIFKLDNLKINFFECDNCALIKEKLRMQKLEEIKERSEKIRQQKAEYEEKYKKERAEIEENDRRKRIQEVKRHDTSRKNKAEYEETYKNERAEREEKDHKALCTHQEDIRLQIIREGIQPHVPEKQPDEQRQKPSYQRDKTRDLLKHKPQNNSLYDFFKKK